MENNPNENNIDQGGVNNPLNDGNMQNPSTPSQTPMTNQNMPPNDMPPNDGNMQNPSTPSQTPMTNQNMPPNDMPPNDGNMQNPSTPSQTPMTNQNMPPNDMPPNDMPPNDMPPQEPENKKPFFKSKIFIAIVGFIILIIIGFVVMVVMFGDELVESLDDLDIEAQRNSAEYTQMLIDYGYTCDGVRESFRNGELTYDTYKNRGIAAIDLYLIDKNGSVETEEDLEELLSVLTDSAIDYTLDILLPGESNFEQREELSAILKEDMRDACFGVSTGIDNVGNITTGNSAEKIDHIQGLDFFLFSVYYLLEGRYPSIEGISSGECTNDISMLEPYLTNSNIERPKIDLNDPDYFYCVDNPDNPQAYILGVKGIDENYMVLEDDIDGNAGDPFIIQGENSKEKCGITSNDTVYCLYNDREGRLHSAENNEYFHLMME